MLKAFEVIAVEAGDDEAMLVDLGDQAGAIVQKTVLTLAGREETIEGTVVNFQAVLFQQVGCQLPACVVLPVAGNKQKQVIGYKYKSGSFHNAHRVRA